MSSGIFFLMTCKQQIRTCGSGDSHTVPGHVELDPGALAQQQGVGPTTATVQQGTEQDEFGGLPYGLPLEHKMCTWE